MNARIVLAYWSSYGIHWRTAYKARMTARIAAAADRGGRAGEAAGAGAADLTVLRCGCCRQPINDHKPVQPVWEYRP